MNLKSLLKRIILFKSSTVGPPLFEINGGLIARKKLLFIINVITSASTYRLSKFI